MAPIYAKLDDLTNLTPTELVDEIYNDDPDVILDVIRKNRRTTDDSTSTKTERVAALVASEKLGADDVVDGFVAAQVSASAERGSALRELLASVFEASVGLEPAFETEQTLMLAFGEKRFSDVVVTTALWESYSFADLARLLRSLIDKMEELHRRRCPRAGLAAGQHLDRHGSRRRRSHALGSSRRVARNRAMNHACVGAATTEDDLASERQFAVRPADGHLTATEGRPMRTTTLSYARGSWSREAPVEHDGVDTLVLVFGAASFGEHSGPIAELRRSFPRSCLVGCSTSGEIAGSTVSDETISAAVVSFERSRVRASRVAVRAGNSFDAGAELARPLAAPDLRGVLVLCDGLVVNGSELIKGINSVLPSGVMVTGGLAGDGARFERTWVLDEAGVPAGSMVTAVGFYGEHVQLAHGSKGGWDPFGPERLVTRSTGNVLYELDGRPALELYKTYLGERAAGLPGTALLFPLSLRKHDSDPRLVRTVLAVDEAAQSMTFAGDIETGARAQLMKANFDRLVQGASDAATMACDAARAQPVLSVAISCVGRRLVLGQRTEEETAAVLDVLPPGSDQVGFYSYGELSPYVGGGPCDLHNQTMTLTTIAET